MAVTSSFTSPSPRVVWLWSWSWGCFNAHSQIRGKIFLSLCISPDKTERREKRNDQVRNAAETQQSGVDFCTAGCHLCSCQNHSWTTKTTSSFFLPAPMRLVLLKKGSLGSKAHPQLSSHETLQWEAHKIILTHSVLRPEVFSNF